MVCRTNAILEKSFHDTTKKHYELSYYYNYNNKYLAVHGGANADPVIVLVHFATQIECTPPFK